MKPPGEGAVPREMPPSDPSGLAPTRIRWCSSLLAVALLAACSRASPEPSPGASPGASSSGAAPRIPVAKEYKETPADKVGTLPEGVGLAVGSLAPEAQAQDLDGKTIALSALLAKGPILLVFYRGGWCPFCNFQLRALTRAFPEFQARGVTPVAVSVDLPENGAKTRATYTIPFPVLADPDLALHRAFRVEKSVGEVERLGMRGFDIDLEASSGRKHHVIAIPSIFLLDQERKVRWAHADLDHRVRPAIAQILGAIDAARLDARPR
jgi:peroxiredoxin